MDRLRLLRVASKYLSHLEGGGYSIEASQDFEAIPDAALETEREYQLPNFAIDRADHTRGSAFWLFLKDGDERIGSVGALLQELGDEDIASYLVRIARNQYPNSTGDAVAQVATPLVGWAPGRMAYIGELCFRRSHRGDAKTLAAFMRFLQVLILLEWRVDLTYAFIPDRHMRATLAKQYGFSISYPKAQQWVMPVPDKRASSEWFVAARAKDLDWFFEAELESADIL
ncbi:MAG: hypothetical protein ABJL67_13185 [Sulfitobacter sp.]